MDAQALEALQQHAGKLKPDDQHFAQSLLKQHQRKGTLSDKQWYWVGKLAERATQPAEPLPESEVGSFKGVVELFEIARKHLKYPKITLALPGGQAIQLTLAGKASKFPGTINVTDGKPFGQNTWYGRVSKDGTWTMSPNCDDEVLVDQMYDLLVQLAEHPAETAKAYGVLTGSCCFCLAKLTDPSSIEAGYGPVCAKKWGLPWG